MKLRLPIEFKKMHTGSEILREGLRIAYALQRRIHETRVSQVIQPCSTFLRWQG